ncbi:MAG: Bug family tripartite tricarboxylate transporter substrate binding protein [Steroidobacteraceae bacterium]
MKSSRRRFLQLVAPIAVLPAIACVAAAHDYPMRPVTLVVPFAAGGPVDVLARIMAERMKLSLGQPVIIDNVAGAAGSIGVGRVARASPDGYTLSIGPGSSTHVTNAAIYNLPYDDIWLTTRGEIASHVQQALG